MRTRAEIQKQFYQDVAGPFPANDDKMDALFLEVLLDIRDELSMLRENIKLIATVKK